MELVGAFMTAIILATAIGSNANNHHFSAKWLLFSIL